MPISRRKANRGRRVRDAPAGDPVPGRRVAVAASVSSDGGEDTGALAFQPRVAGEADGDSGSADDGFAASGENRSDAGTTMASSSNVGGFSDSARLFVQEVDGAVGRVAAAMEQRGRSGSEKLWMDVISASSLIQEVLLVMKRRIERPPTHDLLVELGPLLRALVERGSDAEDDCPGNGETRAVGTTGPSASRRRQSHGGSGGATRTS